MQIDTTSELTIQESLITIADNLIINKAIKINDRIFSFIDLEVFFWHENHPDDYAKGVNHNKETGELEAHRYGIDISLGNSKENGFGGILICGLLDIVNNSIIEKSLITRTLFNCLRISKNSISFVDQSNKWNSTFRSKRNHLGTADNNNKRKYIDSTYKFLAKDSSVFTRYTNKEAIFRGSELDDTEIKKILGYNLKR